MNCARIVSYPWLLSPLLFLCVFVQELYDVGIRLNQKPANVSVKIKKTGGIKFNAMVDLTHCDELLVRSLCQLYKIHNADILFREDATADQLIDLLEGSRIYIRCIYVVNKIDTVFLDEVDRLAHMDHTVVISIRDMINIDGLDAASLYVFSLFCFSCLAFSCIHFFWFCFNWSAYPTHSLTQSSTGCWRRSGNTLISFVSSPSPVVNSLPLISH